MKQKNILTLSVITFNSQWGDKKTNLNNILEYIDSCAKKGSQFIVFPEMSLTGYDDETNKLLKEKMQYKLAEKIPGPSTQVIEKKAIQYGVYVAIGMPEKDPYKDDIVYNSLAIFSPKGLEGSYRKMHLPNPEPNWAKRGSKPFILNTPWGPIGYSICYDNYRFPELRRYYTAMGCRLNVNSTALPDLPGKSYMGKTTLEAGVFQDDIYIATANLGGLDLYNQFLGGSSIMGPSHWLGTNKEFEPYYYSGKKFTDKDAKEANIYTSTINLSLAQRKFYIPNEKTGIVDWRPKEYLKMLKNYLDTKNNR